MAAPPSADRHRHHARFSAACAAKRLPRRAAATTDTARRTRSRTELLAPSAPSTALVRAHGAWPAPSQPSPPYFCRRETLPQLTLRRTRHRERRHSVRSSSGEEARRVAPSVALITERGGTKCALHRERRHAVPRPITILIGEMGIPGSLHWPARAQRRPTPSQSPPIVAASSQEPTRRRRASAEPQARRSLIDRRRTPGQHADRRVVRRVRRPGRTAERRPTSPSRLFLRCSSAAAPSPTSQQDDGERAPSCERADSRPSAADLFVGTPIVTSGAACAVLTAPPSSAFRRRHAQLRRCSPHPSQRRLLKPARRRRAGAGLRARPSSVERHRPRRSHAERRIGAARAAPAAPPSADRRRYHALFLLLARHRANSREPTHSNMTAASERRAASASFLDRPPSTLSSARRPSRRAPHVPR